MRYFIARLLYYAGLFSLAVIFGAAIGFFGPMVWQAWHYVITVTLGFW